MAIIEVRGLEKSYGDRHVLRGIDLDVAEGEILGILGPNGSGKTTAVECIGGLRTRDAGTVSVAGMDPATGPPALRQLLGMQLQQCRLPAKVRVGEILDLYAAFYPDPQPTDELLERFDLLGHKATRFANLSGGQQQRLSVALALVGRPRIAFLDELTTGLDPAARRDIWAYLETLRRDGVTIVLVTHFMEEAQYLCDRVVVISHGRVIADDTPQAVAGSVGGQRTSFAYDARIPEEMLRALAGVTDVRQEHGRTVVTGGTDSTQAVIAALSAAGFTLHQLSVEAPSLDDAFITLTDD